jgi:hypothetical protein
MWKIVIEAILLIVIFFCTPEKIWCQHESSFRLCESHSLFPSVTYINDPCTVAFNLMLEMNSGNLDAALAWSEPECLLNNLLDDYNSEVINKLSIAEKKELIKFLGEVTKSLAESKLVYIANQNEHQTEITPPPSAAHAYTESNLAFVTLSEKIIFLQKDTNARWKVFQWESLAGDMLPPFKSCP